MPKTKLIGTWVRRFLIEYMLIERELSTNTQQSYRDTFRLLLPEVAKAKRKALDKLLVEDLTSALVKAFLLGLEKTATVAQQLGINVLPPCVPWRSSSPRIVQSTSHGVVTFERSHSSDLRKPRSLILRRMKWMRYWLLQIVTKPKVDGTIACSCSFTTVVLVQARLLPLVSRILRCLIQTIIRS